MCELCALTDIEKTCFFLNVVFINPPAQVDLTYLEKTPTFSIATEGLHMFITSQRNLKQLQNELTLTEFWFSINLKYFSLAYFESEVNRLNFNSTSQLQKTHFKYITVNAKISLKSLITKKTRLTRSRCFLIDAKSNVKVIAHFFFLD